MQLPLIMGLDGHCEMIVGGAGRQYAEGVPMLFDDSFLHEVHNRSSADRVVLLCDLWHPDLLPGDLAAVSGKSFPPPPPPPPPPPMGLPAVLSSACSLLASAC